MKVGLRETALNGSPHLRSKTQALERNPQKSPPHTHTQGQQEVQSSPQRQALPRAASAHPHLGPVEVHVSVGLNKSYNEVKLEKPELCSYTDKMHHLSRVATSQGIFGFSAKVFPDKGSYSQVVLPTTFLQRVRSC